MGRVRRPRLAHAPHERLRRAFYDTPGTCGAETDHFDVPLDQCVGPFGKPRPWGEFSLVGGGAAAMGAVVA